MINQPPVLKSNFFIQKFQLVSFWFPFAIFKLKPREHQNPSLLIIENVKKQLFPKWSISNFILYKNHQFG